MARLGESTGGDELGLASIRHVGGRAIVDGAPGVFAAGGPAVSRPPPELTLQGRGKRRRRAAAPRNVPHLPARDELGDAMTARASQPTPAWKSPTVAFGDTAAASCREPMTPAPASDVAHAVAARRQRRVAGTTASRRKPTPHPPTFTAGDVARGAECGAAKGPPLSGLLTGVGMAEIGFLRCARLFF